MAGTDKNISGRTDKHFNRQYDIDANKQLSQQTFRAVAEQWLSAHREQIAVTTYARYRQALEKDIYPFSELADKQVKDITEEDVRRFLELIKERRKYSSKDGEKLKSGTLIQVRNVIDRTLSYARERDYPGAAKYAYENDKKEYEALSVQEMERICVCAKRNHCREILGMILMLYTGIRLGEICALSCNDVMIESGELYIHQSVHRIKANGESMTKTERVIMEIPTKSHIRTEKIPDELMDYVREFYISGMYLLTGTETPMEERTFRNRLDRIFEGYKYENIAFQRLRKTFVNGKADRGILRDVFSEKKLRIADESELDREWLREEMANDLPVLRRLVELNEDDMSVYLDISVESYKNLENGNGLPSWSQYMALLFLFWQNAKSRQVIEQRGMFPDELKKMMSVNRMLHQSHHV